MAAPAGAAAALAAGKVASQDVAGILRTVLTALEKPIYSDAVTTTRTHVARNGDIIVETKSKGWTIPLGVPVLAVLSVAFWEVGLEFANALGLENGGSPITSETLVAAQILGGNPATGVLIEAGWIEDLIGSLTGSGGGSSSSGSSSSSSSSSGYTITLEPTFMAQLSRTMQLLIAPGTAGGQALLTALQSVVNQAATTAVSAKTGGNPAPGTGSVGPGGKPPHQ